MFRKLQIIHTGTALQRLMLALAVTTLVLVGLTQPAQAAGKNAACYVEYSSSWLFTINADLAGCAKVVQASGYGDVRYGVWGNTLIAVDAGGNVFYQDQAGNWQNAGVIRNSNGSTGSLWDRCMNGDIQACNTLSRNYDNAIDAWDRYYN